MLRTITVSIAFLAAGSTTYADTLRAGVAISLKEAITAIAPEYESATGDKLELSFGASGQIATQIKNGAPIDLFISAAQKQVDELANSGHVDKDAARVVCGNTLVLIAPPNSLNAPTSFESLAQTKDARIAIGEPASVPAGEYATQVFKTLKIDDAIAGKLVFGSNVRQVLSYVERGEVSAGIVYATDARQSGAKIKILATADASWHQPIVYPGVVIKSSKHADAAKRFLDYLQTDAAKAAMISRGFTVPSTPATQPAK